MLSFIDYDANTKNYKVRFSGTGSGSGPIENVTTSKITSAILKDDIITVKEQVIFYTYTHIIENQQLIYQIYSDEAKTNLIDTKTFEDGTVSSIDINIDDYNQTSTNTYTFKKDNNGNYYFAGNIIE